MKRIFNIQRLVVTACCIATAYGTTDAKVTTANSFAPQQKITKEGLDNLTEQLVKEKNYDTIKYPHMGTNSYKNSIKEAIKLAIREKAYNAPGAEQLKDIFDDTIGNEETENYLILRCLCKYMLNQGDSLEVAVQRLHELFSRRLQDVEIFAKVADIEQLLKLNSPELVEKLRALTPAQTATTAEKSEVKPASTTNATVAMIDGAKDIFEFIKTKMGTEKDYGKTCNELIKQMPVQAKTEILNISGDIINTIAQEKQQGNTPLTVNWRFSGADAGNLHKYVPELPKSLNNATAQAKKSACLLSENLQATKDGSVAISGIDLITTSISDKILADTRSMLGIARLQILMAVLSKHNVLIVDLAGLNVHKEQFAILSQIYAKELTNPLIKRKLKKVLFVI